MEKKELIKAIAEDLQWDPAFVVEMLDSMSRMILKALMNKEKVVLRPLGVFSLRITPPKVSIMKWNHRTKTLAAFGEPYIVPKRYAPVFNFSDHVKISLRNMPVDDSPLPFKRNYRMQTYKKSVNSQNEKDNL